MRKTILLIHDASPAASSAELAGAAAYAKRLGTWRYVGHPANASGLPAGRFDGIIGHLDSPVAADLLRNGSIPAVSMLATPPAPAPIVNHDHVAIGRLAGEHLVGLGFDRIVYIGASWANASRQRAEGLRAATVGHSLTLREFDWPELFVPAILKRVLKSFRPPFAVLGFNDEAAIATMDAARDLGLHIPRDLAVMGIDNNALRCEFSSVTLTSIDPDLYTVGYRAAELLDAIMAGQQPADPLLLIPPRGLIRRQSTDTHAFEDPDFAHAVTIIRENALLGRSIKELLRTLPISRIRLERDCRRYLGHSPAEEMRRIKFEHACRLLADTQLKVEEIATRCGFTYLSHFSRQFTNHTGLSPRQYRTQNQRLHV